MKKKLTALLLGIIFVFACVPAHASEITGVKAEGNKITADISVDDGAQISKDGIRATLDGKSLKTESAQTTGGKTDYYVMIDTSLSLSNEHFEAQKEAVKSLYNSLGKNDRLVLYTFDNDSTKILDGGEDKDTALKKISAIRAAGQDTAFYKALTGLLDEAKKSDADNVVSIVFTDGVETMNKGAKGSAEEAMKKSELPVYGMYPSVEKTADADALSSLLKLSGGSATAFTPGNVTEKLKTYADKKSGDKASVVFTAGEDIEANEKAVLSVDLGNGETLTKETPVSEWKAPESASSQTETQEASTGEQTTQTAPEKEGASLPLNIIIPAVIAVLLIAAVIIIFAKKKKKPAPAEPDTVTEIPQTAEAEPEEPAAAAAPEVKAEEEEPAAAEPEPEPEPAAEEEAETEPAGEDTDAQAEQDGEQEGEPELSEEEKAKIEAAKKRAEERAARRAANLERAKAAAAARAATMAQMGSESKAAAEAQASREAEDSKKAAENAKKAEKEAAAAAKARAKKEKEDRKKMKEEGSAFQFYFVDGKGGKKKK